MSIPLTPAPPAMSDMLLNKRLLPSIISHILCLSVGDMVGCKVGAMWAMEGNMVEYKVWLGGLPLLIISGE